MCYNRGVTLLSLAGWRFRLDCSPAALAAAVASRYAAFRVPDGPPADFTVSIQANDAARALRERAEGGLLAAKLLEHSQEYLLDVPGICGRIDGAKWHALLILQRGDLITETEYFLRLACAVFAYRNGGLLMHAAALLRRGWAHVFVGPSGSGKSTVVALSRGDIALNDDLVLLREGSAGWAAYGTPFWNLSAAERGGQTASGPIAAFYKLIKDDRPPALSDLSRGAAVAALMASCPVVNGQPAELPGLLARCDALAASVPVRELRFRKDADFWDAIDEHAADHPSGRAWGD
jgi:hypothetical protein